MREVHSHCGRAPFWVLESPGAEAVWFQELPKQNTVSLKTKYRVVVIPRRVGSTLGTKMLLSLTTRTLSTGTELARRLCLSFL